jgi:hypothetical protein
MMFSHGNTSTPQTQSNAHDARAFDFGDRRYEEPISSPKSSRRLFLQRKTLRDVTHWLVDRHRSRNQRRFSRAVRETYLSDHIRRDIGLL